MKPSMLPLCPPVDDESWTGSGPADGPTHVSKRTIGRPTFRLLIILVERLKSNLTSPQLCIELFLAHGPPLAWAGRLDDGVRALVSDRCRVLRPAGCHQFQISPF